MNNYAMVLTTCDSYYDVAKHFFPILNIYWKDFNANCYVINETSKKSYGYSKEIIINAGNTRTWIERLEYGLSRVKEKYILFMMDDYYLGKTVSNQEINHFVDYMIAHKIVYLDLRNNLHYKTKLVDSFSLIPKNVLYGISLQASIWNKEYLLSLLRGKKGTAWEVENIFNGQISDVKNTFYDGFLAFPNNALNIQNGIIKGKWDKTVINFYKKRNYAIDKGNRELLPRKENLRMNIHSFFLKHFSTKTIRRLKKILGRFGFKFVTD